EPPKYHFLGLETTGKHQHPVTRLL
ncbi:hypothetical protein D044_2155B, partial [Vibrio parahaemolyticus EKP-026]